MRPFFFLSHSHFNETMLASSQLGRLAEPDVTESARQAARNRLNFTAARLVMQKEGEFSSQKKVNGKG